MDEREYCTAYVKAQLPDDATEGEIQQGVEQMLHLRETYPDSDIVGLQFWLEELPHG